MPAMVTSTEVERPAAEVFAYATDPARFREWQKVSVTLACDLHGAGADHFQPLAGVGGWRSQR
jgi:uncharacterized protein YndB with AHSA1/START domain